jgi:hypothetical protein
MFFFATCNFEPLYNYAKLRGENIYLSRVFTIYHDCMAKALIDTLEDAIENNDVEKDIPYRQFKRFFKLFYKMSDTCAASALVYNNHYF